MQFPLGFWDISLWLAVTAIILLITTELISPYYGKTNILINKKKTTKRSTNCLNTLPHNSRNKNSHHHNHPMKHKETRKAASLKPAFYTAAHVKACLDSKQTKILRPCLPLLEAVLLSCLTRLSEKNALLPPLLVCISSNK